MKNLNTLNPTKKVSSLFDEFKAFAFKGNVIDLAVGVIIGAAFGKIIDSLVKNIIMPLIGLIIPGKQGYEGWKWVVSRTIVDGKEVEKVVPYGLFIGEIVNFLIVAFALFICIQKFLGWAMRNKQEVQAAPVLSKDQALLTEIRDLLKDRSGYEKAK